MATKRCCFCLRYKFAGILTALLNGGFYGFLIVYNSFNFTSFANTSDKIRDVAKWVEDHMLKTYKFIARAAIDNEEALNGFCIGILIVVIIMAMTQASLFFGSWDEVACLILPWIITQIILCIFVLLLMSLAGYTTVVFQNEYEKEVEAEELMYVTLGFLGIFFVCVFFLFWMSVFYYHLRKRDLNSVTPIMIEPQPESTWSEEKEPEDKEESMDVYMDRFAEKAKGIDDNQRVFTVTEGSTISKRINSATEFSGPGDFGLPPMVS